MIDLRVGDFIQHRGRSYIIDGIEAYRETSVDESVLRKQPTIEGYLIRGS